MLTNKKNIALFIYFSIIILILAGGCGKKKLPKELGIKPTDKVKWHQWDNKAFEKAKASKKKLMVVVYSPWNTSGVSKINEVLDDDRNADVVNKEFIPVLVDSEKRPDISKALGVGNRAAVITKDGDICEWRNGENTCGISNEAKKIFRKIKKKSGSLVSGNDAIFYEKVNQVFPMHPKAEGKDLDYAVEYLIRNCDRSGKYVPLSKRPANNPVCDDNIDYERIKVLILWLRNHNSNKVEAELNAELKNFDDVYDREWGGVRKELSGVNKGAKLLDTNAADIEVFTDVFRLKNDDSYLERVKKNVEYLVDYLSAKDGGFYGGQTFDIFLGEKGWMNGEDYYRLPDKDRTKLGMPVRDKTIYTDRNAKLSAALIKSGDMLSDVEFRTKGLETLNYIMENGFDPKLGAAHFIEGNKPFLFGILEDNAAIMAALLEAYQTTGDNAYLKSAEEIALFIKKMFYDDSKKIFLAIRTDDKILKKMLEGRIDEASNFVMIDNLEKLYHIDGKKEFKNLSDSVVDGFKKIYLKKGALAPAGFVLAAYANNTYPLTVAVVGSADDPNTNDMRAEARRFYEPLKVVMTLDPKRDKKRLSELPYRARESTTVYACLESACSMPIKSKEEIEPKLKRFNDRFMGVRRFERSF